MKKAGAKKVVKKKKKKAPEPPKVESLSRYTNFDDYERKLLSAVNRSDWVTVHVRFRLSIRDEESAARQQRAFANSLLTYSGYQSNAVVPTRSVAAASALPLRTEQPCDFKVRLPLTSPLSTIGRMIATRHGPLASLILTRKPTDNQPLAMHLTLRELDFDTAAATAAAAQTAPTALSGLSGPNSYLSAAGNTNLLSTGSGGGGSGGGGAVSAAALLNRLDAEREIWFDFEPAFALQSPLLLTDPCLSAPLDLTAATATATATATTSSTVAAPSAATSTATNFKRVEHIVVSPPLPTPTAGGGGAVSSTPLKSTNPPPPLTPGKSPDPKSLT